MRIKLLDKCRSVSGNWSVVREDNVLLVLPLIRSTWSSTTNQRPISLQKLLIERQFYGFIVHTHLIIRSHESKLRSHLSVSDDVVGLLPRQKHYFCQELFTKTFGLHKITGKTGITIRLQVKLYLCTIFNCILLCSRLAFTMN